MIDAGDACKPGTSFQIIGAGGGGCGYIAIPLGPTADKPDLNVGLLGIDGSCVLELKTKIYFQILGR